MPLVCCPNCPTKLRIPDGILATCRCPKCHTIFQPSVGSARPEITTSPPTSAQPLAPNGTSNPSTSAPNAPSKSRGNEEFEIVINEPLIGSTPPSKKPAIVPPRPVSLPAWMEPGSELATFDPMAEARARARNQVNEKSAPAHTTRDDPQPSRSPHREAETDELPEEAEPSRDTLRPHRFGLAIPGLRCLAASFVVYGVSLGLYLLLLLIAWLGGVIPGGLLIATGVLGLIGWMVGTVGIGLCVAGPAKGRGFAIAAIPVALCHLLLLLVLASDSRSWASGAGLIEHLSALNRQGRLNQIQKELAREMENNPQSYRARALRDELATYSASPSGLHHAGQDRNSNRTQATLRWGDLITQQLNLDKLIAILVFSPETFQNQLLSLLAGATELTRFLLLALLAQSLATAVKSRPAARNARMSLIGFAVATGMGMIVLLVLGGMIDSYSREMSKESRNTLLKPPERVPGGTIQEFQRQHEIWRQELRAEMERQQETLRSHQSGIKNLSVAGALMLNCLHGVVLLPLFLAILQILGVVRRKHRRAYW